MSTSIYSGRCRVYATFARGGRPVTVGAILRVQSSPTARSHLRLTVNGTTFTSLSPM
jgi:hypothetical protein